MARETNTPLQQILNMDWDLFIAVVAAVDEIYREMRRGVKRR